MNFLIVVIELTVLYILSKSLTKLLYVFFYSLTKRRVFGIQAVSVILFPGTVVHELSHLFTAEILGVRTGKFTLTPEILQQPDATEIQSGSVTMAPSGPFRRTAIGLAPFFWGMAAYTLASSWLPNLLSQIRTLPPEVWFTTPPLYLLLCLLYLLFSIGSTLFPSQKDMKGVPGTLVAVGLLILAGSAMGIRFDLSGRALDAWQQILVNLVQSTTLVLAVHLVLFVLLKILLGRKKKY